MKPLAKKLHRRRRNKRRQPTTRKPYRLGSGCEVLERRLLLTGSITLSGTVVVITGDSDGGDHSGDTVHVSQPTSNRVEVRADWGDGSSADKIIDLSNKTVTLIEFNGHDGGDKFENSTSIPSHAVGGDRCDTLIGGGGIDTLIGQNGEDKLSGMGGADELYGESGNDTLLGGEGTDSLDGGDNDDLLNGETENDTLRGQDGKDELYGMEGDDTLYGGSNNDTLFGGQGNDSLEGGNHDDYLYGDIENDTLRGQDGEDKLWGLTGDDDLWGGGEDDFLFGGQNEDECFGGGGHDVIYGGNEDDTLEGGFGNDTILAGDGEDVLEGGPGDDTLRGEMGVDLLLGQAGNDGLFGGYLADTDVLLGGGGADRLLTQDHDLALDKDGSDAEIHFIDDSAEWTDREILEVDVSLGAMHDYTNNTVLLKLSPESGGGELDFLRVDAIDGGVASNDSSGTLRFADVAFQDPTDGGISDDMWTHQIVFHEIGHNWDEENTDWDDFLDISGWAQPDLFSGRWEYESGEFASNDGRNSPLEDFATCFAVFFMNQLDGEQYCRYYPDGNKDWVEPAEVLGTIKEKTEFIHDFLAGVTD